MMFTDNSPGVWDYTNQLLQRQRQNIENKNWAQEAHRKWVVSLRMLQDNPYESMHLPALQESFKRFVRESVDLVEAAVRQQAIEKEDNILGDPPEDMCCPILHSIMHDPVCAADGHSYEKSAIENWLAWGNHKSPCTGAPLDDPKLLPNHTLKKVINSWRETRKQELKDAANSNSIEDDGEGMVPEWAVGA